MGVIGLPRARRRFGAYVAALAVLAAHASAIRFYLQPGERRCFTDELPSNSKISGEALVASGRGEMEIDVWVTTVGGTVLYHRRAAEHGKFSFRTPALSRKYHADMMDDEDEYDYEEARAEEDTFKVCVEHQQVGSRAHAAGTRRMVSLKLNEAHGPDGDDAAEKGDTDRLEATMKDMQASLRDMMLDLDHLQWREKWLTKGMQRTTGRVTALAVFSLAVMVATSAMQYRYYLGYFKQKKLC